MSNPLLFKNYVAGAAIAANTLVKFGADDNTVLPAAAASDLVIGVSGDLPAALGERVDVVHVGIGFCVAGAAVARGSRLMSDASARAIAAAAAAGTNVNTAGVALETAAAAGDVIRALVAPATFQG
ncbi:MAG: DUF2190 family protein [Rubrivivax sp.]